MLKARSGTLVRLKGTETALTLTMSAMELREHLLARHLRSCGGVARWNGRMRALSRVKKGLRG